MQLEILAEREGLLIRRMILEPGEAMHWHTDPWERFTVVVRGERLAIEFRDGERQEFPVAAGLAGWDQPDARVHRAINVGGSLYEEVVTFFRDRDGADPQPRPDDGR